MSETKAPRPLVLLARAVGLLSPAVRRRWVVVVLLSALTALFEAATAGLVFELVRRIADPAGASWATASGAFAWAATPLGLAALLAGFTLFKNGAIWLLSMLSGRVIHGAAADLSRRLFERYLTAPYERHLLGHSADRAHRVLSTVRTVVLYALAGAGSIVTEVLVAVALLVVLFYAAPLPAVLATCGLGLLAAVGLAATRRRALRHGERVEALERESVRQMQEGLGGLAEVRVHGLETALGRRFAELQGRLAEARVAHQRLEAMPRLLVETSFVLGVLALVALFGGAADGGGQGGTLPVLGLFAYAGFRLVPVCNRILLHANSIWFARAAILDLEHELAGGLREATSPASAAGGAAELPFERELRLQGVGYGYAGGGRVLDGVDLVLRRGELVGLVGVTGAGKSTLLAILLGLLEPSSGRLLVDGDEVSGEAAWESWRRQLGYVGQQPYLFDGSVCDNVALGVPEDDLDEGRVRLCLERAQLGELVSRMPNGLATRIGERGGLLSGGERQRLAIARALYREPALLLCDEATAHLDAETEGRVADVLAGLRREVTVLLVSHRREALDRCDRVVELAGGRLTELEVRGREWRSPTTSDGALVSR